MVTRYDVISSRWSSLFWMKMHVFPTSFNNKSKACGWNDAKSIFLCYFTCKAQNTTICRGFNLISILSKIQNGDQDGDHCWWRHRPPAAPLPLEYTSYCWEDRRRSTKGKIASKYCNISKTLGRGSTWKRTQQLPTFMAQRFWELLRLFACSLQQWVSFHHSPPFENVCRWVTESVVLKK